VLVLVVYVVLVTMVMFEWYMGVDVVVPPGPTPWGTRWFVVRDPDGTLLAFEEVRLRG